MPFNLQVIEGIQVVIEGRSSNQLVGVLTRVNGKYHFEYNSNYLALEKAISLGPEMPLTRRFYESDQLFRPFAERIPSRENPAFLEYCKASGITADEKDPLVLLHTIASRGPSSFLFKPIYKESFNQQDLKNFRKSLGLTVREFADCFDFSHSGVTRVETGKTDGSEILKRVEIYVSYPEVTLDQLDRRSAFIHRNKLDYAKRWLGLQKP